MSHIFNTNAKLNSSPRGGCLRTLAFHANQNACWTGSWYSSLVQYWTSQLALLTVHSMHSWVGMLSLRHWDILGALRTLSRMSHRVQMLPCLMCLGTLLHVDQGDYPVARCLDIQLVHLGVEGTGQAVPQGWHYAKD